jgi:hypothetical protein
MQNIEDKAASAIIAAVISIMVTIILRFIEYSYNYRLDKKKNQLSIEANIYEKKINSRLDKYAVLVEYIYRYRNLSRDLLCLIPEQNRSLLSELERILESLRNYLYSYRFDLEQDNIFSTIHEYVHIAKHIQLTLSDYYSFSNLYDESHNINQKNIITKLFEELDEKHKDSVLILTKIR